jgi:hypothetical protein
MLGPLRLQLLLLLLLLLLPVSVTQLVITSTGNSAHMQIERTKVIKGKMYTAATAAFCDVVSSIHVCVCCLYIFYKRDSVLQRSICLHYHFNNYTT